MGLILITWTVILIVAVPCPPLGALNVGVTVIRWLVFPGVSGSSRVFFGGANEGTRAVTLPVSPGIVRPLGQVASTLPPAALPGVAVADTVTSIVAIEGCAFIGRKMSTETVPECAVVPPNVVTVLQLPPGL